jgi:hypothetical protein
MVSRLAVAAVFVIFGSPASVGAQTPVGEAVEMVHSPDPEPRRTLATSMEVGTVIPRWKRSYP